MSKTFLVWNPKMNVKYKRKTIISKFGGYKSKKYYMNKSKLKLDHFAI